MGRVHGDSLPVTRETNMMKLAIVVCLAAYVAADATSDADADPALLYSSFGYGGYPYHGLTYGAYRSPYVHHPYVYGGHRYYANSGGAVHIVKREADAEPALYGYSYGHHPFAYSAYHGYPAYGYRYSGYPYGYNYGYAHHYGKRSADADADAHSLYRR